MMSKKISAAAIVLSLGIITAGSAFACEGGMKAPADAQMGMSASAGHTADKRKHLVRKVIDAVSKTGLDSKQTAAVTEAVNAFKARQMELRANKVMPIDAFGDDKFDAALFRQTLQNASAAKIDAKAELFTSIYAILSPEQRAIFKREFTAPMVRNMIKQNMIKGGMMPMKGMGNSAGKGCSH